MKQVMPSVRTGRGSLLRCCRPPPFDPLCAPCRGVEWVGKVLGFMRHFSIPKLHNAHGVGALAFVDNHVLSDPEIALSHDPADRKPRWPARVMTTKRLQVTPTANYL